MTPSPARPLPWRSLAFWVPLGALLAGPAPAHVVTTKDGTSYEGEVVVDDSEHVVIETSFEGRKDLRRADVSKVDLSVPPLRRQFAYRLDVAKDDPKAILDVADWAKKNKFPKEELDALHRKVLEKDPQNAKAHKALGHVKVGARWMTAEEKAQADAAAEEAAQRAKGLVPHEGRWVTPAEKEALEKGLVKDGDEWVTKEQYHLRRGERLVDGAWVRIGEAQAKARAEALSKSIGVTLSTLWSPHVDLIHELDPAPAQQVLAAAEKTYGAFRSLVQATADDKIDDLRVPVVAFLKAPAYARFAQVFAEEEKIAKRFSGYENWPDQAKRQPGFWWVDPIVSGHYLFPNTVKRLESGVAHNVATILFTRWRFNWRFPSLWLQEGVAYACEMRALGASETFTVGRAGGAGGGDPSAWTDHKKWKDSLRAAALAGQDAAAGRLATFSLDQMSYPELVKAWSLVEFLVKTDAAKFRAFLAGTKVREKATPTSDARDKPEEEALKEAYGFDFRGLESAWRKWLEAGFPP